MPLYDYDCAACGQRFEILRGVHTESPSVCVLCGGGPIKKAFATPAIHFKGSGWAKKERHASAGHGSTKAARDGGSASKDGGSASQDGGTGSQAGGSTEPAGERKPKGGEGTASSSGDGSASSTTTKTATSNPHSDGPSGAGSKAD
jgi:putative regulatory protein, FmdB family